MSRTIIVADPARSLLWSTALQTDGADIERIDPARAMADLFQLDPADIAVLEVDQPHSVTMMLIPQIKHFWPACRILAIATKHAFAGTSGQSRGAGDGTGYGATDDLWTPHRVLIRPINARVLRATVALMRAGTDAARISCRIRHRGAASPVRAPVDTPRLNVIPDNLG